MSETTKPPEPTRVNEDLASSTYDQSRSGSSAKPEQAGAATGALESIRHEVRVGQRPVLDLLDAEREALAVRSALVAARGDVTVQAYRLDALLGGH